MPWNIYLGLLVKEWTASCHVIHHTVSVKYNDSDGGHENVKNTSKEWMPFRAVELQKGCAAHLKEESLNKVPSWPVTVGILMYFQIVIWI